MPLHNKLILLAIYILTKNGGKATTGEVYSQYRTLCQTLGIESVTQRRVSDIISELDMVGIINAQVVSRGRYGKTRIISLAIPNETVVESLKEDIYIAPLLSRY
jgi:cell division control protein 6